MQAASGTTLHIDANAIDNTGNILVAGTLAVDVSTLTLDGTGTVTMAGGALVGTANGETLHNSGNTISGTGTIGDGSGHLALDNDSGTIAANGGTLVLDTGATISNAGMLEAESGATLKIDDPVTGTGGSLIGAGATMEFAAANSEMVTFNSTTGKLILDQPSTFGGEITGFTGDGTLQGSDQIDLRGLNFATIHSSYDSTTGILEVTDGTTTADIKFVGSYSQENFKFADDGSGGTTLYDPPVPGQTTSAIGAANQTVNQDEATLSAASQHAFVFAPNFGQIAIANFTPAADTIQFSKTVFANINAVLSAIHDDASGNAVITDTAHDAITLQHVTTAQLLAHQSDFHFV